MQAYYEDILSSIDEKPIWFDEHSVPRYCRFEPKWLANELAEEAALVLVQHQFCDTRSKVACTAPNMYDSLHDRISGYWLQLGDPPNIRCCDLACASSTCETLKILEYWVKNSTTDGNWVRDPTYELDFRFPGSDYRSWEHH